MVSIVISIGILATSRQVWSLLSDIERQSEWMTNICNLEINEAGGLDKNTTFQVTSKGPFGIRVVDDMECVESIKERQLTINHVGRVKGVSRFTLDPIEDGTRLTWYEDIYIPLGILGKLIFRIFYKRKLRRTFIRDLWKLKKLAERTYAG